MCVLLDAVSKTPVYVILLSQSVDAHMQEICVSLHTQQPRDRIDIHCQLTIVQTFIVLFLVI